MVDNFHIQLAQDNFISYCIYANEKFVVNYHHREIAEALESVERGECTRLIIEAPPRHSKSLMVSENFLAWYLGKNPSKYIIHGTYGQDLSSDFGRKLKNTINSEDFQTVFPEVLMMTDSKSSKRFNLNKGGTYYAVGRGGPITGRGGHLIVLDDPLKNSKEADSALVRAALHKWYQTDVYTRLMTGGAIIIMATRWHESDLTGFVLEEDKKAPKKEKQNWKVLKLPAIDENHKALWSEFYPIETLNVIKRTLGSRNFEALYQQNPSPPEGSIIKRKWLKYYRVLPNKFDEVILSWDMAFKESETSDYVVGHCWGVYRGNFYLIDRIRDRMDFPTTINAFRQFTAKHPSALIKLVEVKANGQAVVDTLSDKIPGIVEICPTDSKISRLSAVAPLHEAGNVYYPDPSIADWINDHIEEVISFPQGKHDDSVDAESQALTRLMNDWKVHEVYSDLEDKILM